MMSTTPDPAITKALSLDPSKSTISSYGQSGFSSTFKITTTVDGVQKLFFVKTGSGKDCEIMFAGEHASLNAIHAAVPSLCPQSHAHGPLSSGGGFFLVTDFLTLSSPSSRSRSSSSKSNPSTKSLTLAQKLMKLHSTPAPTPPGHKIAKFGFPLPTCCGNTLQDNTFQSSWADFYANNRLRHILRLAEQRPGYRDTHLSALVEKTAAEIVPRLLRDGHLRTSAGDNVIPVVVHGDLWSGNHGRGRIGGGEVEEEVVFDPSASWSHGEFEFGIMRMFGGLGSVEREYFESKEKDEPTSEFEDRVRLYELYHHLNHYSMFGGGYKGGAIRIMEDLIQKYGA